MAIEIKTIPTLKDKSAYEFEKRAATKSSKRATVDFSRQARTAFAILEKARLR